MFKKLKNMVGIEGVKIKLDLPKEIHAKTGVIAGRLYFLSKQKHTVTDVSLRLIEKYSRGRGDNRLTDEYELGRLMFDRPFQIEADEPLELDFELPFELLKSDMDSFEGRLIIGKLATAAKMLRQVKSEYRIEAEAKVKGALLNPFVMEDIKIRS